jgi:fibro-slime domain-containing protein
LSLAGVGLGGCGASASGQPTDIGAAGQGTGAGTGTGGSTGIVVPGGGTAGVGCTSPNGCTVQVPEGCGDGINNQGGTEVCDDGNTVAGDGCNGACKVEANWSCPAQGACTRLVVCNDGKIGPGEVCDDGNNNDGDGCNATCTYQDPAYVCIPGQLCTRARYCGNGRIETGENCDDGNGNSGDGCSATCVVESGFTCPVPGRACKAAPRCGDGVVNVTLGEKCDDGNTSDGDGCSADCKTKQTGCICQPGKLCQCPVVACGNGKVEGTEACDDGNQNDGDGCSSTCTTIETGYDCPFSNAPCVPSCGDGIVLAPMEQCDPAVSVTNMAQACSSTCRWNPGWACVGNPPTSCHATTCGDGNREGSEACDDGNTTPGDGCSATCRIEPSCSAATGTCTSICGDGIVMPAQPDGAILPGGGCDDGNTINGDGCSSSCTVEQGYQCQQPPLGATMIVPVVYRDFVYGGDFEPSATGQNVAVTGLVGATLDSEGKPTLVSSGRGYITSAASFAQWYRDVPPTNSTYKTTLTLYNNGNGGFVNRWGPNGEKWAGYANARWCSDATCSNCNAPAYVAGPTTACLTPCTPWGDNPQTCAVDLVPYDGNPVFFPVDNVAGMVTPTSQYATAAVPPAYGGTYNAEPGGKLHNFSFTSEVRYWFGYVSSKQYVLDFTGDDDVWVFINRRLAVDLGGIHTAVNGRIQLDANGGGTVTITQTEPTPPPASLVSTVSLGMQSGGVYEIVVFQAERQTTASTYKLTLSGFNDAPSECKPLCGDSIVSPGEACDNGDQNLGGYNQCTADCRLGPYCGDRTVNGPEACDNGVNDDQYGSTSGCGPDCQLPARCGDAKLQVDYGETCDDGVNSGAYGSCTTDCQQGPFCGDGAVNGSERCDDGVNDGTYGTCGLPTEPLPNCAGPAPRCGDGTVQTDYGEQCEPTSWDRSDPLNPKSTDLNCTSTCRLPASCGNGVTEPPEQCDDGVNNGDYGGCAPSCIFAPHCGDGVKNGPEECDDGYYDGSKYTGGDGSYGGCTAQCKLAAHCGDGHVDAPTEECDNGAAGADSICSSACKKIIYIPA